MIVCYILVELKYDLNDMKMFRATRPTFYLHIKVFVLTRIIHNYIT